MLGLHGFGCCWFVPGFITGSLCWASSSVTRFRGARPTGGDRVPTGEHPGRGFLRQSLEGFGQAFAGLERLELLLAWLRAPFMSKSRAPGAGGPFAW